MSVLLCENDIPGLSLAGRKPAELKTEELIFLLRCRNNAAKGLQTKAQLVKWYKHLKYSCDQMGAWMFILFSH